MFIGQRDPSHEIAISVPLSMVSPEECMRLLDDAIEPEYLPPYMEDAIAAQIDWEEEMCWSWKESLS